LALIIPTSIASFTSHRKTGVWPPERSSLSCTVSVRLALTMMSAAGTKRTYQHDLLIVRFRGEAGVRCRLALMVYDAIDPSLTSKRVFRCGAKTHCAATPAMC
jgi:hypothetical protein